MLTIEEQERRAYISGNIELAAALGASMDLESERIDEAEYDARELRREVESLEDQLQVANERIDEAEYDARELRREVESLEDQLQVANERIAELEQALDDARA